MARLTDLANGLARALSALLVVSVPLHALAFNRTPVTDAGDGGPFLFWKDQPVSYAIQSRCALADEPNALNAAVVAAGEDETTFNQLCHAAIERAFTSWTLPPCTSLRFDQLPDTPTKEVGYDKDSSSNLNTVQFMTQLCDRAVDRSDPCWDDLTCDGKYACFGSAVGDDVVALTQTVFDTDGQLLDVDIEANAATYQFSAEVGDPLPNTLDVQNTFTHEAGHFIGLAHSCEQNGPCSPDLLDTTMYWSENALDETTKRTLKQDDINGLCTIYPLGDTGGGGCSTTGNGEGIGAFAPLVLLFLASRRWPFWRSRGGGGFTYPGAKAKIPLR